MYNEITDEEEYYNDEYFEVDYILDMLKEGGIRYE